MGQVFHDECSAPPSPTAGETDRGGDRPKLRVSARSRPQLCPEVRNSPISAPQSTPSSAPTSMNGPNGNFRLFVILSSRSGIQPDEPSTKARNIPATSSPQPRKP